MAICLVSGTILDPAGSAVTSATVYARVLQPTVLGTALITPYEVSASTDTSGNFSITVQQSLTVVFTVQCPVAGSEPMRSYTYTGTIPGTATATFSSIITIE
jgi:hypothetical protein